MNIFYFKILCFLFLIEYYYKTCILTSYRGAPSTIITCNCRLLAADLRKPSTVRDLPIVKIISFECMCSEAWAAMLSAL